MGRYSLVTQIHCGVCGTQLELILPQYEESISVNNHRDDVPNGAYARDNKIQVEPCPECLKPLKQVKDALSTLAELAEMGKGE